jgi:tetratricopeptide (TPR) repeat protein
MMGEIELEQGSLPTARALLTASAAEEKSGSVLLYLARLDRHDDQIKAALEDLRVARDAADTARDPALHGDILLTMSDLARESGDAPGAHQALVDALTVLVKGRTEGPAEQRAHVEQVLARVLDRFGAKEKAQQALERAFEATPHDKRQIAATLGQVVARAFVRKDLLAAHDGLTRAIASELGDDEIVYYALWVHLLEKQLKRANDPTPGRVFASIPDDGHWVGKLAAYGAGKLPASDLLGLARTKAEKTEATFYQVMDARTSGQGDPGDAGLRSVLRGDGVDLMEELIARELLLRASGEAAPPLPAGVKLP